MRGNAHLALRDCIASRCRNALPIPEGEVPNPLGAQELRLVVSLDRRLETGAANVLTHSKGEQKNQSLQSPNRPVTHLIAHLLLPIRTPKNLALRMIRAIGFAWRNAANLNVKRVTFSDVRRKRITP